MVQTEPSSQVVAQLPPMHEMLQCAPAAQVLAHLPPMHDVEHVLSLPHVKLHADVVTGHDILQVSPDEHVQLEAEHVVELDVGGVPPSEAAGAGPSPIVKSYVHPTNTKSSATLRTEPAYHHGAWWTSRTRAASSFQM